MVTLYNVISADGYIARKDGGEDFIPDALWPSTLELFKKYDALVMGKKTYEAMQKYDQALLDPFEALPRKKVVVTRDADFVPRPGYIVVHSPKEALSLEPNTLVSSGPGLNSSLIRDGLVDTVIWQVVPVEIGEGIKPFNSDAKTFLGVPSSEEAGPLNTKLLIYRL